MPTITQIVPQRRQKNRRNIYLDGAFAFGCNINVVARFRLREGLTLGAEQLEEIQLGEVKQECFDHAMRFIEQRPHGRVELSRKLARAEYGAAVIAAVIEDLQRLGYVNDEKFASALATSSLKSKLHGRQRARQTLAKAGVDPGLIEQTLGAVYEVAGENPSLSAARKLASKLAPRLQRLEMPVARRRLAGMLQRRGFGYDTIRVVMDEALGADHAED